MIKSKEEYYSILERLRTLNFNQKLSRNLQAKLEAFEEMEELVNLTIPVVGWRSEQLPEFDVQEINEILQDSKKKKEDFTALICRIWNKGYMTAVNDEREG